MNRLAPAFQAAMNGHWSAAWCWLRREYRARGRKLGTAA